MAEDSRFEVGITGEEAGEAGGSGIQRAARRRANPLHRKQRAARLFLHPHQPRDARRSGRSGASTEIDLESGTTTPTTLSHNL